MLIENKNMRVERRMKMNKQILSHQCKKCLIYETGVCKYINDKEMFDKLKNAKDILIDTPFDIICKDRFPKPRKKHTV